VSHFEYVSVAVALLYSLALARLLGALPHVNARDQGARIAMIWVATGIISGVVSWWILWRIRDVDWTPLRFAWLLAMPFFYYVQSAVLVSDSPGQISSWEDHFFAARKKFFGIGLAMSFQAALLPWIVGTAPWFSPTPVHAGVPLMFGISVVGLRSESRPVHLAMALLMFALTLLSFFLTPHNLTPHN
jgi:hypothetical protein